MPRASRYPTLPQNVSQKEQEERRAQLATTRESYVWTTAIPTLPGVPLAANVPPSSQPSAKWMALLGVVAAAVEENLLANKLFGGSAKSAAPGLEPVGAEDIGSAAARDYARIGEIKQSMGSILAKYTKAPRAEGPLGSDLEGVVKGASKDKNVATVVDGSTALIQGHLDELLRIVETHSLGSGGGAALASLLGGGAGLASQRVGSEATVESANPASVESLSAYEALFKTLALPSIASNFMEDSTFARLRVAGPNPMLLTGIDALPNKLPLSADVYKKVMGDSDSLDRALSEGRVYMLDYAELEALVPSAWEGLPKFPYAPIAVFAVPLGGSSLKPVAIQCGQDPASNPIFTPASDGTNAWGWQMAKTTVQIADGNYHSLYVHLARTHLVMDAFAVATHRCLAEEHPLWGLFLPHVEGSLSINNQAARSLIAAGGPIDNVFAGTIASTQAIAVADRLGFDFYAKMLPSDLKARKVDQTAKLPDYPYRDDALLVWNALHGWANQYVGIYYTSESDVTGDVELQAWATALAGDGKLKGFRAITTRDQLVDVCTMLMFTGSAQHAAVNFPQKDLMTFAPAISGAGWTAAPTVQAGHTQTQWLGYLPPLPLALEQLGMLYLLGSVYYGLLGEYTTNEEINLSWFRDPAVTDNALPRFQAALKAVETQIDARNRERLPAYNYLKPSRIPTSTNV